MTDEKFKITLQILQVLTPNFYSNSVSAKDDFNALLQWCKGFSHCKITFAKISHCILQKNISESDWLGEIKFIQFFQNLAFILKRFENFQVFFCNHHVLYVGLSTKIWMCSHDVFYVGLSTNICAIALEVLHFILGTAFQGHTTRAPPACKSRGQGRAQTGDRHHPVGPVLCLLILG